MNRLVFNIIYSLFFLAIFVTPQANAQNVSDAITGLNTTANKISAFSGQTGNTFNNAFLTTQAGYIIGLVLSFIGILFLGLIIYAGIMWMTAAGNEQQVTKSKDLIVNAIIGLIVIFAAYAITAYIGSRFSTQ